MQRPLFASVRAFYIARPRHSLRVWLLLLRLGLDRFIDGSQFLLHFRLGGIFQFCWLFLVILNRCRALFWVAINDFLFTIFTYVK